MLRRGRIRLMCACVCVDGWVYACHWVCSSRLTSGIQHKSACTTVCRPEHAAGISMLLSMCLGLCAHMNVSRHTCLCMLLCLGQCTRTLLRTCAGPQSSACASGQAAACLPWWVPAQRHLHESSLLCASVSPAAPWLGGGRGVPAWFVPVPVSVFGETGPWPQLPD